MKSITRSVFCVLVLAVAAGCASTNIVGREEYTGGKIPRPAHIWVYDFAATPAEVPTESALSGEYSEHPTPQTPEQIATGRQLGDTIATQLVQEIRDMGLPAERASRLHKAADQRPGDQGCPPLDRRGQRGQARRHRVRRRGIPIDDGGRRLPDDGSGSA